MKYIVTQYDKGLLTQNSTKYSYKLFVIDKDEHIVEELSVLSAFGTYNIDAESDIRRTTSFTMYLDNTYRSQSVEKKLYDWIGYNFQLKIGIYSIRDDDYKWYDCGYYLITDGSTSYNATENSITAQLSDLYAKINGTRNGQIGGAPTILIPNEDENGNIITIKQATEVLLKTETNIKKYIIDDIGQFYGMPQNNPDYIQYRKDNPKWNQLPYELEYEAGCTVGDIFSEIEELYPNCQMYFDIFANFCFDLIPSCEYEPIVFDNEFIQSIITSDNSESVSYNIQDIKNVTEVFGAVYDVDRFADKCTSSSNMYTLILKDYEKYFSGDIIAFTPASVNVANMKIKINELEAIPLYYEYTETFIKPNLLETDKTYVFQVKKVKGVYVAYYLGKYQPHALCVLTDNENDPVFTKSYFSKKYNCDERNIVLRVENGSPFTVQKLGEILDVKTGDEFENIISDSVALENAIYFNRKSSSVNDIVTISTKLIPFLDVNIKIEYKKQQVDKSNYYIVQSVSNDMESSTSSITMYRFYPLYYL